MQGAGEQPQMPCPRSHTPVERGAQPPGQPVTSAAPLDDAALVAATLLDRQAFKFLYERHANRVYRYCYLKLGSPEAAEDALSEVFLKALANLGSYRGRGVFAGWLFR